MHGGPYLLKTTRALALSVGATLFAAALLADVGMWMPQQIPEMAAKLKAMGFKGDPKAFADLTGQPMGAIVSLGGCTASFVSCLLYTSPSPRDGLLSRMPSS